MADLEPLHQKLHNTTQEKDALNAKITHLEEELHHSTVAASEHESLVANLRARVADSEPMEHRLHVAGEEIGRLRLRVEELEPVKSEADELGKENESLLLRIRTLEKHDNEHVTKIHKLEGSLKHAQAAEAELKTVKHQLAEVRAHAHDWETRFHKSSTDSAAEIERLRARIAELEALQKKLQAQEEQLHSWDRRFSSTVQEKDGEIGRLRIEIGQLAPLREEVVILNSRFQTAVAEKDSVIEQLRGQLQVVPVSGGAAAARAKEEAKAKETPAANTVERDDLKLIWGIGPVLEKRLNEYGIHTFRQIAQWTKQDIVDFETHLPPFKNRVERDQWVAAANEEHLKKYGEKL